jgi:hypothetical protein
MIPNRFLATIIIITWCIILGFYALSKVGIKIRFLKAPIVVDLGVASTLRAGSLMSGAGVLLVFVINIADIGLVFGSAMSAPFESAARFLRFTLPLWVNITGGILFLLYSLWRLLVLFYNPYTQRCVDNTSLSPKARINWCAIRAMRLQLWLTSSFSCSPVSGFLYSVSWGGQRFTSKHKPRSSFS